MKKRSSFLVIAAAVMLLALSAAPVLDLIRNDNDGDTSLSKFEGYTPISSPADLAKIGNSYPLNGKYYLTDNITFGPNDDKNGGMNMRISVSIDSGYLKFQLLSASGSTLFNTMSWSLYVDGVYVTGSKINTISMPVPTAGTHSFVLGGIIYDTGSQNTKYEFAYAREIRTNGSSMTPVTFNISSNGNFNPIENFTGIFDGNGYKISGLDIRRFSDGSELSMGFFKNIAPGAKVENLGLVDGSVTVLYKPEWKEKLYVGGIAGTSSGYIGNCYNSLNITVVSTTETSIGGIVGLMSTEATICYNTGNISALVTGAAELHVGGIAGGLEPYTTTEASASKCFNTGSIDARSTTSIVHAGGILGHASAAAQVLTISDCYNTGSINAKANYFGYSGGILGYTHNTTKISNCYSVGQITSTQVDALNYSGGIVGYSISAAQVSLVNCYYPENYAKEIVRGYATLDGSSSPARKADQGSGPKSVNSMRPTLQDAYAGTSVYYTGTTTVNGKTVKGWDFAGTWTIIKGVNDGFPILNRTAVISGTVKFIDNTPLAGVEIVYTLDGASYVPVITDSAGKYSVPVPVGCEFEFKDLRKNGLVLKGGLPDPFTISIDREYNFIMDYDPDHEFRISGTVTFNGTGMGGVDIWYTVDNGTPKKATTETDGTYLIEEKVYTTVRITNIDPNDPIYKVNSHSYDKFAMTEDHENINFTLRYNEDLTLNVKGAVTFGGSPVNGAVVTYKINGTQSSVMTDASGMYTINVHPGDNFAFVSVTSASGALKYSGTMPSFTVTGNATHNFVLDYDKTKKFTVSGKLTAEGAPVAGGVVTYAHGGAEHKVISDASGNYSIDVYAGDNFAFVSVASASGGLKFTGTLPSFTVLDNEIHNFSLDYDKTKKFTVSGNVTMNGTPLDGAIVKYTINGVAGLVKTNAGGSYTISVNSGDVFVFISVTSENEALKYTGKMPAFTVSDDEMHNFALNYDTTKKYTVSGKVTFGGTPLSGAVVTYTIGGIGYTKTTDASGNYSIDVYSGDKFVFVSVLSADLAYAFPGSLPSFTVIGNEIHNFALDYNKGISFIVSGTVTLNGAPVSGAVVTYSIDGAQSSVMT
ncbi:MAG: hypothetical protein FWG58_02830, partial [Methanomassiliicoccaceae archaeon]|nr:hypothetical protein [Methanomassiliicoccaceae archaeon]